MVPYLFGTYLVSSMGSEVVEEPMRPYDQHFEVSSYLVVVVGLLTAGTVYRLLEADQQRNLMCAFMAS